MFPVEHFSKTSGKLKVLESTRNNYRYRSTELPHAPGIIHSPTLSGRIFVFRYCIGGVGKHRAAKRKNL
jgi:hypothetical protein